MPRWQWSSLRVHLVRRMLRLLSELSVKQAEQRKHRRLLYTAFLTHKYANTMLPECRLGS